MSRLLPFLALLLAAAPCGAVSEEDLLPVDEAFAVSARAPATDSVNVTWRIADGYYLYRHRFGFESLTPGVTLGEARIPPGEPHTDEFFGDVETYRGSVTVQVPISGAAPAETVTIRAALQGCADVGVCYPPHRQTVQAVLPATADAKPAPLAGNGQGGLAAQLGLGATETFAQDDALPVDEAFRFEAIALGPRSIGARFQIAEGYYLYRDKFDFELAGADGFALGQWSLPPGEPKTDEHFGAVRVYYDLLEATLPVRRTAAGATELTLVGRYQGCKEDGICYPPQERRLQVSMPPASPEQLASGLGTGAAPAGPGAAPVSEQDRLAGALLSGSTALAMALFFGAGLLLAFTPCVFPMVPILAGILTGQGSALTTRRAFALSLVYVLAMAVTYTAAGVIAGLFGQNLQAVFQQPWILVTFSLVFVLLALSMFGFYELQLPARWQARMTELSSRQEGGTWAGVALMGLFSALIVGPCVAPPLAAALIVIGEQGDPVLGGAALFALSLGMGAPLLVLGASAGRLLPRAGPWMEKVKHVFGVLLLALAIWLLSRIVPEAVTMALWGLLFIVSAVYLGALEKVPPDATGWRYLWKGLGAALLVAGAVEILGAAAGGGDWLQPLRGFAAGGTQQSEAPAFETVQSVDELERTFQRARASSTPVLLDFYADWCVDCKRMERYTYPDPAVRELLDDAIPVKADVTANSESHQALLQRYGLMGPPATLFFTPAGEELRAYRVIGFMEAGEFAAHARAAFRAAREGR